MIFLRAGKRRHVNNDNRPDSKYPRANRLVSYPPLASGMDSNLVGEVEHHPWERVIWHFALRHLCLWLREAAMSGHAPMNFHQGNCRKCERGPRYQTASDCVLAGTSR
jgi:hypothetical protein